MRLCPYHLRDKGAYYLCGTTLVPVHKNRHSISLYRARPGAAYSFRFGALLRGDMVDCAYCLAPSGSSLESVGVNHVSSSKREI